MSIPITDKIKELTFPVPWGVIAAKSYGHREHEPVLMIHGLQDNAGTFDRLMPLLPNNFYYVCIDLPGHGKSSRLPKGIYLNFMLYINAIRRVIQQLKWNEFQIIGHSLGGQLGSYYAAFYPKEVKKLTIFDTLGQLTVSLDGYLKFYQEHYNQLLAIEEKMSTNQPPNYTYEEALRRLIDHRPYPITKEAAEALLKRCLKETKNGYYCFSTDQRLKFGVRAPMTTDQHINIISKIQCPVLILITNVYLAVVVNCRSPETYERRTLDLFLQRSNVSVIEVKGYHDVHNNEPEVVAPYVYKFMLNNKSNL